MKISYSRNILPEICKKEIIAMGNWGILKTKGARWKS